MKYLNIELKIFPDMPYPITVGDNTGEIWKRSWRKLLGLSSIKIYSWVV
jgi:hypothetical protein